MNQGSIPFTRSSAKSLENRWILTRIFQTANVPHVENSNDLLKSRLRGRLMVLSERRHCT